MGAKTSVWDVGMQLKTIKVSAQQSTWVSSLSPNPFKVSLYIPSTPPKLLHYFPSLQLLQLCGVILCNYGKECGWVSPWEKWVGLIWPKAGHGQALLSWYTSLSAFFLWFKLFPLSFTSMAKILFQHNPRVKIKGLVGLWIKN